MKLMAVSGVVNVAVSFFPGSGRALIGSRIWLDVQAWGTNFLTPTGF